MAEVKVDEDYLFGLGRRLIEQTRTNYKLVEIIEIFKRRDAMMRDELDRLIAKLKS